MKRAVFLDRDGVIKQAVVREGQPFSPVSLEQFVILPEAPEACAVLKAAGVDVDAEISRMGDPVPPIFWLRDPEGNTLMVVQ